MPDAFTLLVGDRSPSALDVITIDGRPVDLATSTVAFAMNRLSDNVQEFSSAATAPVTATTIAGSQTLIQGGELNVTDASALPIAGAAVIGTNQYAVTWTGKAANRLVGISTPDGGRTVTNLDTFTTRGVVQYDWAAGDVDTAGEWSARWIVTTAGKTQTKDFGLVTIDTPGATTGTLCTLDEVKLALGMTDSGEDERLEQLCRSVTAAFQKYTSRELVPTATATRILNLPYNSGGFLDLSPYDLRAATLVRISPEGASPITLIAGGTASNGYLLGPAGGMLGGTYGWLKVGRTVTQTSTYATEYGSSQVEITGSWGPSAVPEDVKEAAIDAVCRWFRQRNPKTSTFGGDQDTPDTPSFPVVPHALLGPYKRMTV